MKKHLLIILMLILVLPAVSCNTGKSSETGESSTGTTTLGTSETSEGTEETTTPDTTSETTTWTEGTTRETTLMQPVDAEAYPVPVKTKISYRIGEVWRLIDRDGYYASHKVYDIINDYQPNGYAIFKIYTDEGLLCGLVDQYGKEVLAGEYADISNFSDGICILYQYEDNQYYIADEDLNFSPVDIPDLQYINWSYLSESYMFSEGLIGYATGSWDNTLCGFMDYAGQPVVAPQFEEVFSFYNGRCVVRKPGENPIVIGRDGNKLTDLGDIYISDVYEGYILYSESEFDKVGYMDYEGNRLTEAVYEHGSPFIDGYAVVIMDIGVNYQKTGVINDQGTYIIEPDNLFIENLGDGLFAVARQSAEIPSYQGEYLLHALYGSNGKPITGYQYYSVKSVGDNYLSVSDEEYTYFINRNGTPVDQLPKFPGIGFLKITGDLIMANIDGLTSYYDLDGQMVWDGSITDLGSGIICKTNIHRIDPLKIVHYPIISGVQNSNVQEKVNDTLKALFVETEITYEPSLVFSKDFYAELHNNLLSVIINSFPYMLGEMEPGYSLDICHIDLLNGDIYQLEDLFKSDVDYAGVINAITAQIDINASDFEGQEPYYLEFNILEDPYEYEISPEGITIHYENDSDYFEYISYFINFSEIDGLLDKEGDFWKAFMG